MESWRGWLRPHTIRRDALKGPWPLAVGSIAMAAVGAIVSLADLSTWQGLALGLTVVLVLASMVASRLRGAPSVPAVARVRSPGEDFDPDEVIIQDANSGRTWRLGEVHFLGAAEKRRLAAERPNVWKAYRARLFPFPLVPPPGP